MLARGTPGRLSDTDKDGTDELTGTSTFEDYLGMRKDESRCEGTAEMSKAVGG